MATSNLYRQAIFCLHGPTGELTADAGAGDTTFSVQAAVLADVTIELGSIVKLNDGTNVSVPMVIVSIDEGANTFATNVGPGAAFLAATPSVVVRDPHWVSVWTGSPNDLTECPEDAAHPVQAGSAKVLDESSAGTWVVSDTRPPGVVGGSYPVKKVWAQRALNTITGNAGLAVQLAVAPAGGNQLLIDDGSYLISGSAPGIRLGHHKIRLRNVTDGADAIIGTSARSDQTLYRAYKNLGSDSSDSDTGSSIPTEGRAFLEGVVDVVGGPKVFELQHFGTTKRGETYGLGDSTGAPGIDEVYSVLSVTRLTY